MNLNFLVDSDQQIHNTLTEEKLAHHLSVELAQGNHFFLSSICSPAIPVKWGWHDPRNMFQKGLKEWPPMFLTAGNLLFPQGRTHLKTKAFCWGGLK